MPAFTFNGVTIVAPGFILKSTIGLQRVAQLLPFGKLLFIGPAEGGMGGGTIYEFNDLNVMRQTLRSGALVDAFLYAASVGGASSYAACVANQKGSASATISTNGTSAVFTSGDQGSWTNQIFYQFANGSNSGFAVTFQWPDENGNIITYGGLGSPKFDNLSSLSSLAVNIAADPLLTPPVATKLPAIITLAVTTDGQPNPTGLLPLTGGYGSGALFFDTVAASPAPTSTGCYLSDGMAAGVEVGTYVYFAAYNSNPAFYKKVTTVNHSNGHITFISGANSPIASQPVSNLASSDYITALNECVSEPFDLGCLVGAYDSASQAYADELSVEVAPLGRLSRWIHQIAPSGLSPNNSLATNSEILVNAAVGAATSLDCSRSSIVAQHVNILNPQTGLQQLVDLAPIMCGWAAYVGATQQNGPATAMTQDVIPNCISLDYPILGTNNTFIVPSGSDLDRAILGGVMPFEQLSPTGVRCTQSVTTAPNDANGNPWIYAEFSVQRVVDAVAANIKAAIQGMQPKGLGSGNNLKTSGHIIAMVIDILRAALKKQWITAFNKDAIYITPVAGSPTDAIVYWDMTPVEPLNHLGLNQTIQPFSVTVSQQQAGG